MLFFFLFFFLPALLCAERGQQGGLNFLFSRGFEGKAPIASFFCNCPGYEFSRTQIANSTHAKKEFNPMDFVHGRGKWEEPAGITPASLV